MTDCFLTEEQLGTYFGVSAQRISRWLTEVGLIGPDGAPDREAIADGIAVKTDDGWVWREAITVAYLHAAGYGPNNPPPPAVKFQGPFSARRSDPEGDGFEIGDANGITVVWTRGEWMANVLVRLLNACWLTKKWF